MLRKVEILDGQVVDDTGHATATDHSPRARFAQARGPSQNATSDTPFGKLLS
jgi:hypothetical protein